jgi:hypothetical protein
MTTWGGFAAAEPELAAFVSERLRAAPSYLATVRATGAPRVHPVTPAASYDPADRYLLFELRPTEVRCNGYGDVALPERRRWRAGG